MHLTNDRDPVAVSLKSLAAIKIGPLDLLPRRNLVEKLIELMLTGLPPGPLIASAGLEEVAKSVSAVDTTDLNVVVFGGGSGLSNVIGGDSRNSLWHRTPFQGLKEVFPRTKSIVCVTDDGGSTGELLKDLPIVALGDLRHVLLSSIRRTRLKDQYQLSDEETIVVARVLHGLFNTRFSHRPESLQDLLSDRKIQLTSLPEEMGVGLLELLEKIFSDFRLFRLLDRPHCLGNLLLAAAVYQRIPDGLKVPATALVDGIKWLADLIGVNSDAVLPCVVTPAHLNILYSNGVLVSGEDKSSSARRNSPIDRVFVAFSSQAHVLPEVLKSIEQADIIVFAPGSLYTSIIPIFQVPELSEAVRRNRSALKILVANLWVQKGETDYVHDDPKRRFYVSDLIKAYHRNIPGGVEDLFEQVLLLGLQDIPGNILQSYAVEDKMPIYLDRGKVWEMGFAPVEAPIFSEKALQDRRVQHDPASLAVALKTIWAVRHHIPRDVKSSLPPPAQLREAIIGFDRQTPSQRLAELMFRLKEIDAGGLDKEILDICWRHQDIRIEHLALVGSIRVIPLHDWHRSQKWDNVLSYYDPGDSSINIRQDVRAEEGTRLETAFLVALGQSLLGDYAAEKKMLPIEHDNEPVGRIFQLALRKAEQRSCYFDQEQLEKYLCLVRMNRSADNNLLYTRLVSGNEGFTPPGLLMGLMYAWYLDNRLAPHIEYKMAIIRTDISNLVPEQVKMYHRRLEMISFFRKVVFRHSSPAFEGTDRNFFNEDQAV